MTHTRRQLDTTCADTGLPTFACECWFRPIPADQAAAVARERGLYRDEQGAWQEAPRSDWYGPEQS